MKHPQTTHKTQQKDNPNTTFLLQNFLAEAQREEAAQAAPAQRTAEDIPLMRVQCQEPACNGSSRMERMRAAYGLPEGEEVHCMVDKKI